jgi:hypothetical protein
MTDAEWKTQSLPSLGHVSSDNTLESIADDYGPKKGSQKKMKKVVFKKIFFRLKII